MSRLEKGSTLLCPKCKAGVLTNNIELRPGDRVQLTYFTHLQGSVLREDEPITCYPCKITFTQEYVCIPANWTPKSVES